MTAKARAAAVKEDAPAVEAKAEAKAEAWKTSMTDCVVNDGTGHMGRATPGTKICSRHALRYKNDGTPRQ